MRTTQSHPTIHHVFLMEDNVCFSPHLKTEIVFPVNTGPNWKCRFAQWLKLWWLQLSLSLSLFKTKIKFKNNIPPSPKTYEHKNKKVYSLSWAGTLIRIVYQQFHGLQTLQTTLVESLRVNLRIMILSIPWYCLCLTWLYILAQQWNWMGGKVKMCVCTAGSRAQEFPKIHKIYWVSTYRL